MGICFLSKSKASLILAAIFLFLIPAFVYPQGEEIAEYPSRLITFINAIPQGGPTDLTHRFIAKGAEKYLRQPILVVNNPSGGTTIGMAAISVAKPDGYAIGHSSVSGLLLIPHLELEETYTKVSKFPALIEGMKEDLHLTIFYRNSQDLAEYGAYNYEAYGKMLKEMGLTK